MSLNSAKQILLNTSRIPLLGSFLSPTNLAVTQKWIHLTPCVQAEPMKKRKKIDQTVVKARDDRRKRRIEKMIRYLEKNEGQLKPIDELEVPQNIIIEKEKRTRPKLQISESEEDARSVLLKAWTRYKYKQHLKDMKNIKAVMESREKALEELKLASEELYIEAIQLDLSLIPFRWKGPVRTSLIPDYISPDGEYYDISRNWDQPMS